MPSLATLATPAPYHILSYGTLLGTTFYQSFIGGTTAYRALPRPQFSSLQQAIFPIYFLMQTALPVVLALTYPGTSSSSSFGGSGTISSIRGVLDADNRWSVMAPIAMMTLTGAVNWLYAGPKTTKIMKERKHQETRDGKKSYDNGPHSPEMQRLNKAFMRMHGISSLVNLVALLATMWYGVELAERL